MTPPRRSAWVVAGVALVAVLLITVLVVRQSSSDGGAPSSSATRTTLVRELGPARAPFSSLTAGTLRVGSADVHVVVADDPAERVAGLRGRSDVGRYDGMLFVFEAETTTAFTMAGVPGPLDIGFYAADGTKVDQLRMEPCAGTDATCPIYRSSVPFRYALETVAGHFPPGALVAVTPRA